MNSLETTVTLDSASRNTEPQAGVIDGQSLPNVAGKLDKFSILRKIGAGGMGEVYAAYDEQLGRKVAIKLLHADLGAHNSRFMREAQGLARLNHPNVVQVYELGIFKGKLFIVMEFVAGVTLKQWLRSKKRTRHEILTKFMDASRGLAAAHDANLVHRDFKPDNVMVGNDDRVRVMDFGLVHEDGAAKLTPLLETSDHGEAIEISRLNLALNVELTMPGSLLGTPAYMAPEQHLGLTTDARADQFAFCVTLWEALYGKRPFGGATMAEIVEAVTKHALEEPARSSDVPTWLRAVIERGLAVDPKLRWPSMAALLDALQQDPTRRRRWIVGGLSTAALLAASLFANQLRVESKRDAAQAAAAQAAQERDELCTAEGASIDAVWNAGVRDTLEAALLGTDHRSAASVWQRAEPLLDEYAKAWSATRREVCIASELQRVGEAGPADLSTAETELARVCLNERRVSLDSLVTALGKTKDAGGVLFALSAAHELPSVPDCVDPAVLASSIRLPDDPTVQAEVAKLRERTAQVRSLHNLGNYADARVESVAILDEALTLGWDPLTADAHYWVGWLDIKLGHYEGAQSHLEDALFLAGASHDPAALRAASSLVFISTQKRNYADALRWGRLGQLFARLADAPDDLPRAKLLTDIGTAYSQQGDREQSIRHFNEALQLYEARLPPGHPALALILNNLGMDHYKAEDYPLALTYHQRALALRTQSLPPAHRDIGVTRYNLGLVYEKQGSFAEAVESYRAALTLWETGYPNESVPIALIANSLGRTQLAAGDDDDAALQLERALELRLAAGPNALARDIAETRLLLARVRTRQGELHEAADHALAARSKLATLDLGVADPETLVIARDVEEWLRDHGFEAAAEAEAANPDDSGAALPAPSSP